MPPPSRTTWPAEKIYSTAHDAMMEGNYTRAIKLFETLESRYPYGRYAQQAILEGAQQIAVPTFVSSV